MAMERRPNILPIIMLLLFVFISLSSIFDIPPILYFIAVVVIVAGVVMSSKRPRVPGPRNAPPEFREFPFLSRLGIGRWIMIPIAIIGVVVFILFQNWWLDVKILTSMYLSKAGTDWWKINFLDNYYFYICIAVGLLITLSDPRILIEKDVQGKRRFYLHSKFWAMINAIVGQMSEYEGSPFAMIKREQYGDRISLKRGVLWKLLEFVVGTLVIGPMVARNLALGYIMISKWIESQHLTWIVFLQKCFLVVYTRVFTPEVVSGFELGNWLIANSPMLEFLLWLRTPVFIFAGIWSARLIISSVLEMREGQIIKVFRNIVGIGFLLLIPYFLQIPSQAFDVTTPFYVRTAMIAMAILLIFLVFLSLKSGWVQLSISRIFRNRIILFIIIAVISASLLYGPVVVAVQYAPAMQGRFNEYLWQPKYLPNVIYTRWATGLEFIKEDDVDSAINTGTNLDILRKIRVFNDGAAQLRLMPSIGVNWMNFPQKTTAVDIIYAHGREYWVAPLTIVLPPGADVWRSSRLLITHSERILAIDAATGEIVPISGIFNLTKPYAIYYGEGGLFTSSPMVYVGIPNSPETRLSNSSVPAAYNGKYDYVLDGFDRLWFFSGLYGRERLAWDFGRGDFGPINMLFMRDIEVRLSQFLLPGMTLDSDPYLVSDGNNMYYSFYVYVDREMPTEYLDYPANNDRYWRTFATVLVNAYDGSIQGYLLPTTESNYVLDFYRAMYPQWAQPIPEWLLPQLRYPEFLFEKQIDSYNTYHVSNPDYWQQSTDFFELTSSASGAIEDVRYVIFYLNGTIHWAAVRLVEYYRAAGKNLAGMYVALNGAEIGNVFLFRTGSIAVIGPQTALDTINNYNPTKTELTLHSNWESGNILMYVINNRPYYFIPYYAKTATTLSPTMITVVDAFSQKVGYYVINDPGDAKEVGLSSERGYLNLIGAAVGLTTEARKTKILDEFMMRGYRVESPQNDPTSLFLAFRNATVNYYSDADWAGVNSTLSSFISSWVAPYNMGTILMWEMVVSNVRYLNLGVLINRTGAYVELRYITIAYG